MKKYTLELFENPKVLLRLQKHFSNDWQICWKSSLWHAKGYATFNINGKSYYAHRLSWMYHNNKNWPNKLEARHICNNSWCLNPLHIVPGTRQQNADDRNFSGNQVKGDKSSQIKISESLGLELIKEWQSLPKQRGIKSLWKHEQSKKYNVSESLIGKIVSGQTRKYYQI